MSSCAAAGAKTMKSEVRIPRRRGGQPGNTNRRIHGAYSKAAIARRKEVMALVHRARRLIADAKAVLAERKVEREKITMIGCSCNPLSQLNFFDRSGESAL